MNHLHRPVENLTLLEDEPSRPLADLARGLRRVLGGGPARVALLFAGATGAVTLGQVLAVLITHC